VRLTIDDVKKIVREELAVSSSESFHSGDRVTPIEDGIRAVGVEQDPSGRTLSMGEILAVVKGISPTKHGNLLTVKTDDGWVCYVNPADVELR